MMGYPHASVLVLLHVFASLMLLVATHAFASADNVSNALQIGQPSSIQITLSKQADTAIRLEARAAPLGQILKAIADKTGAQIHYSVLPPEPVTASCAARTVSGLLECLLGFRADRVYRYPRNRAAKLGIKNPNEADQTKAPAQDIAAQPEEIWLLATNIPVKAGISGNNRVKGEEPEVSATPEPTDEEQAQIEETIKQARSKNVDERSTALYNLGLIGQKDDPNIRKVLEEALADNDPNVRTQAITSLMQREGENAAFEVQQALKDTDINVRMAVLGNVYDVETLQQALADSDQSVRDFAKSKLDDMTARQSR